MATITETLLEKTGYYLQLDLSLDVYAHCCYASTHNITPFITNTSKSKPYLRKLLLQLSGVPDTTGQVLPYDSTATERPDATQTAAASTWFPPRIPPPPRLTVTWHPSHCSVRAVILPAFEKTIDLRTRIRPPACR